MDNNTYKSTMQNLDVQGENLQQSIQPSTKMAEAVPAQTTASKTNGPQTTPEMYKKRNKFFIGIIIFILLTIFSAGIVAIKFYSGKTKIEPNGSKTNIQLRDLSKEANYFLSTEKFQDYSFNKNVTEGDMSGYYILSYKNPWGIKQESDDNGCTTATYTRGPINLGKLTIKLNCNEKQVFEKIQPDSIIVSKIINGTSYAYILRQYDSNNNLYKYLFIDNGGDAQISSEDTLANIISLYPFSFSAIYTPEGTDKIDEGLKNIDTMMNSFRVENLGKPVINDNVNGVITGKITLNYEIDEYPNVYDDINVLISEKRGVENNYFGASTCDSEEDNCVWLISKDTKTRTYNYKLTLEGGADIIRANEYYLVYVSTRHWNDISGNVAGEQSEKIRIDIPLSGKASHNFSLTVDGF